MVILGWPKMSGKRNIDLKRTLYHQEKGLPFDNNSYQQTPLAKHNFLHINLICLISIVGKINQVALNVNFDKKWELCQFYLDNGICWFELSKCIPFS